MARLASEVSFRSIAFLMTYNRSGPKESRMKKTLISSGASSLLALLILAASSARAQYVISTFAGGVGPPTPAAGTSSSIGKALSVTADTSGNIYFDSSLACVFKQDGNGIVTRVAGTCRAGYSGDGGPATEAQLGARLGVALDSAGNLYIADGANQRVRKVGANGTITTVAGGGQIVANGGDGGPAILAQVNPTAVAFDSVGNMYIGDGEGLREVLPDGTITSIAKGDIGYPYGVGGVAVDSSGNIFATEPERDNVRKISPGGAITTLQVANFPHGLAADGVGNLYIAAQDDDAIIEVAPNGAVSFVAGSCSSMQIGLDICLSGFKGDGGPATSAILGFPYGVGVDSAKNVYIADTNNRRIRKVSTGGPTRIINTIAGNGSESYSGDGGPAGQAQLGGPSGAAFDLAGNLYFADVLNDRIRRISPAGIITTFAGKGTPGFSGDGGPAINAQLNLSGALDGKVGLAIDPAGNLYIADGGNKRIRKVSGSGVITTAAAASGPDVAVDGGGNIYVSDSGNILRISPAGVIATIAQGTGPLVLDSGGNLYFSGQTGFNFVIRKISPGGVQTLVVQTSFGPLVGMALDSSGGVYFASSSQVAKASSAPLPIIAAGNGSTGYSGDGGPALSAALNVSGLAVDASGDVYVMDGVDNAIRVLRAGSPSEPAISLVANAEGESPTIAPNTWVEIKGFNLAPAGDARIWKDSDFVNGQMPTQLDGISVSVGNKPAYVYYISATQLNILTAPDIIPFPLAPVQVQNGNNGTSNMTQISVQAASPSFFVFNGGPYVAAVHANGSLIGPASLYPGSTTPAQPGETVLLYANGFGSTNVPVTAGSKTQSGTLSPLPVVKLGGIMATVSFAGLVAPGEFQFNVTVPVSIADGDLSIAAVYNGLTTPPGTLITIHH